MIDVLRLAAFTDDPRGGNPAGVVLADDGLPSEDEMGRIAAEVGYSETAFLAPTGPAAYRVRFFSPAAEVDFCGHATIAAGVVLGRRRGPGTYAFATNPGEVPVEVAPDGDGRMVATLTSVATSQREVPAPALAAALATLRWDAADLDPAIPVVEAFAGNWHLVLAARTRARLADLDYDFDGLRTLMLERGLTTVQLVHRADATTFDARDPFPVGGVVEDPATGAAAAALCGYLRDAGLVSAPADLVIRQGEDMGRPSRLLVHVPTAGGIRVSGTAVDLSD